jgi:hypothetical protein
MTDIMPSTLVLASMRPWLFVMPVLTQPCRQCSRQWAQL